MSEDTIEVMSSPADTIVMDMELDRQSSHTVEGTNDGLSEPEWERRDPPSPMRHTTWTSNTTAMAKCDYCERGSRGTLQQCHDCSRAICQECFDAGKLIHPHQLDADSVDWNQHNKSGRSSKKRRLSRARPRFDSSSATTSAGTSASPHSQERGQFGGVVPPDTASPSNSVPSTPERPSIGEMFNHTPLYELGGTAAVMNHHGNKGYAAMEPQPSSDIEQEETPNNWNSTFSQSPDRHRGYLNDSSSNHGATLASSEDPSSWNGTFGQRRQDHQGSSAYRLSAYAIFEDPSSWNMMFGQPQTRRQQDQMQTSQDSTAFANNGEWRQSFQSSSAYDVNQPAYHDQQEPAANLVLRSHRDLSSSWQLHNAPYPSASRSNMYYSGLLNYGPIPIAVAPAAFLPSPSRGRSTPRVLPERIMPRLLSLDAMHCEPSGPPRRYEDYFDLH